MKPEPTRLQSIRSLLNPQAAVEKGREVPPIVSPQTAVREVLIIVKELHYHQVYSGLIPSSIY